LSKILADLGGTHLRLARAEKPEEIRKYTLEEFDGLDSAIKSFAPDITQLYLASAIQPRNGVIEDRRFNDKSRWIIDLAKLQSSLMLQRLIVLNDLEAAAYALSKQGGDNLETIAAATQDHPHFDHPPKLLIGIGTGIGHAHLFEKPGHAPFVQRTHGGHIPVLALSDEQKKIVATLAGKLSHGRDMIVEDVVSGNGLQNLKTVMSENDALRLFCELLGLYCNTLTGAAGSYGGIYLTGGVMNELMMQRLFKANSFAEYFHRPLVPVLIESLASTPVYYCKEPNMPIAGLAEFAKGNP